LVGGNAAVGHAYCEAEVVPKACSVVITIVLGSQQQLEGDSSVIAHPVSGRASVPAGRDRVHIRLAWWGVGIAAGVAIAILVSAAIFAVAYAVGGPGATEDNWVGLLGAVSLLGGLVASLAAFALALAAKIKHEQWALLWLPFLLFPALFAFLVLGELFWWE
jgi:hypothetical protein